MIFRVVYRKSPLPTQLIVCVRMADMYKNGIERIRIHISARSAVYLGNFIYTINPITSAPPQKKKKFINDK